MSKNQKNKEEVDRVFDIFKAMNQATGAIAQAETVDPETGEIIQPATENPAPKAESKTIKLSKEPSK